MAITYLKKSPKTSSTDDTKTREIVENILKDIEKTKEEGCIELSKKFDKYEGEVIVTREKIEEIKRNLDPKTKDDIQFSHERVRKFAEAQLKNYGQDFEVELSDGLFAGQKLIPVNTAGCYVPAGRYAHIASAVMSVTTAKVAGVKNIIVCSSPKPGVGVHPAIVYTADLCGADVIMNLGGQAEHGYNSPAWLFTTSKSLAEYVMKRVPELIADLPDLPRENSGAAWRDYGEVILCDTDEEMAKISDEYAPEHLEIQTKNLQWFHDRLKNYGSLFIGEETTVAYGDKCSGTNHILPTKGAGKYTGGLFVGIFIKTLSFQRMTKESTKEVGAACARISRYEGMEAHARTGDVRLRKYGFQN